MTLQGREIENAWFNTELDLSQPPVIHTCSPSYLGGRDWEGGGLKPVKQITHEIPNSHLTRAKGTGEVPQTAEH
jgi:hypothetical protein